MEDLETSWGEVVIMEAVAILAVVSSFKMHSSVRQEGYI